MEKRTQSIKVGDILHSDYFNQDIRVIKINSDVDWYFEIQGQILKAHTPLSYFEEKSGRRKT